MAGNFQCDTIKSIHLMSEDHDMDSSIITDLKHIINKYKLDNREVWLSFIICHRYLSYLIMLFILMASSGYNINLPWLLEDPSLFYRIYSYPHSLHHSALIRPNTSNSSVGMLWPIQDPKDIHTPGIPPTIQSTARLLLHWNCARISL